MPRTGRTVTLKEKWLSQSSITPGSVLAAARMACGIQGWLIVEESLGITCSGTLGIITSDEDYFFAAGKKSALGIKVASAQQCKLLLLAKNIPGDNLERVVHIEDVAASEGTECSLTMRWENLQVFQSASYTSRIPFAADACRCRSDAAGERPGAVVLIQRASGQDVRVI